MKKLRIFIVEDNAIIALDIGRRVKKEGHSVIGTAASADEALSAIEKDPPDLILMDVKLKGEMDGIETAKRLQEKYNIPIIYITAYSEQSLVQRAMKTKPIGLIIKPINNNDLNKAINTAIQAINN